MTLFKKYETVETFIDGPIATVWLNRPDKRNACSLQLLEDVAAAYTDLQRQYQLRVVIMGGRGKTFCAGADRNEPPTKGVHTDTWREARHAAKCWDRAGAAVRSMDAITIGRVHGHASGGGLGMAFINDMVICEESTRIWLPEVELGTPMIGGLTPVLSNVIGPKRAIELLLLGEDVSPAELKDMGLINRVVKGEETLDTTVKKIADKIVAQPEFATHSVKMHFRAIYHGQAMGNITEADGDMALIPALRRAARGNVSKPRSKL